MLTDGLYKYFSSGPNWSIPKIEIIKMTTPAIIPKIAIILFFTKSHKMRKIPIPNMYDKRPCLAFDLIIEKNNKSKRIMARILMFSGAILCYQ